MRAKEWTGFGITTVTDSGSLYPAEERVGDTPTRCL